jgi:hypothetical protein
MKKGLQKILLLIAVVTVTGHSILPHIHHDETLVATQQHHDEEQQPSGLSHHDDKDDHHDIFSFAQLDENFVPENSQNKSFELPLTYLPVLIATYLSDNFPVNTKTHFGWYKEYPPPDKNFPPSSHRGPPAV